MIIIILLALALIGLIYFIYNTPATEESANNGTTIINITTMRNPTTTSFVAVDYETMTKDPASICAAGFVKVKDGVVHEQYYTLVKPVDDNRPDTFTYLHGISREMVAWVTLKPLSCNLYIRSS